MAKKKAKAKAKTAALGPAVKNRYSKSEILTSIADSTGLPRKSVGAVLDSLDGLVARHISARGCGEFVLPGLLKILTVKKPARKARKGINPFTGEETMFKAKPASIAVKIRPLKRVKEMAAK
jgi:nucleoid DNA-binding protein